MTAGQWIDSGDGVRWHFDAGSPSLDFGYTGDWELGVPRWEQLHEPADLGRWLAERFPTLDAGSATAGDLRDARALRDAVTRIATAIADDQPVSADDVDTLNLYAAAPDVPPALAGGRRQAGAGRIRVGQALSSLARDAVRTFDTDARHRIRRCAADDCRMVFADESRTGSRRWCSMQRCGNRAKVRAHRARAHAHP